MPDVGSYVELFGSNYPVVNYDGVVGSNVVHLRCTHAGTSGLSVTLTDATMKKLAGKFVLKLRAIAGSVPVTSGTSLEITDSDGYAFLDGNGTSFLPSAGAKETKFYNSFLGFTEYQMFEKGEPLTISTSGNSVSGANFELKFYLVS